MKFKKIAAVFGTFALLGATMGLGVAYSPKFTADVTDTAIVYGANAAASDAVAGNSILDYLKSLDTPTVTTSTTTITGDFSSSSKVTYDELELGSLFSKDITDNKVSSLIDYDFRWDDGTDTKNYDVHEEIIITNMGFQTTLDNDDLNNSVVLENNEAIEYRYVFDDELDRTLVGDKDADTLYLTILGNEYEILSMDIDSITVSSSDKKIVTVGSTITVGEVTLTIGDIFENTIEINGVFVDEERKKTIKGVEVYVENIAYHPLSTLPSKAIIKVGTNIEQTFDIGDEYIKDNEMWVWNIQNLGSVGGFIGVKYDIKSVGFDDDETVENAISLGQSYILPENYGAVTFSELTNVSYEDFEVYFDDVKLYSMNNTNPTDDYRSGVDVAVIEGENDDSIKIGGYETDRVYFEYVNGTTPLVSVFFKDIDGDRDPSNEGRNQFMANYTVTKDNIATLIVDDTELKVGLIIGGSEVVLTLEEPNEDIIEIPLGIDTNNKFKMLGVKEGDANNDDLIVDGESIGTQEDDVMDHYGVIIRDPESYADDDMVLLSVPDEQVFATIKVSGQGEEIVEVEETNSTEVSDTPIGVLIVKDTEINNVKDKNLIVVGGSCINAVAAQLLGLPANTCGSDFTAVTNVGSGQYLIKEYVSPYNADKVALLVAGYEAADTTAATTQAIAAF